MAITTLNNRSINRSDTAASGQVWTATSATAADFQAVSADYVKLATVTADAASDATAAIDGHFTSDYDVYILYGTAIVPGTTNQDLNYNLNVSGSAHTSSEYVYASGKNYLDSTPTHYWTTGMKSDFDNPHGTVIMANDTHITGATTVGCMEFTFYNPLSTTEYKWFKGTWSFTDTTMQTYFHTCRLHNTSAVTGVTFKYASGNIGGKWKLYRLK